MFSLEHYLGWETMRRFLRTYYERWRFRHPTTRDLIDVAEEVSGEDLGWFFDQYVYGTATVDCAVTGLSNQLIDPPDGAEEEDWYRSLVTLNRKQDGTFPQDLLVRFADGTEERVSWDGQDEWKRFTFEMPTRAVEAYLDPDNAVWLDIKRLDNRVVADPEPALARHEQLKFTTRFQQFFYLVASLF
jgi:hypothetical protein